MEQQQDEVTSPAASRSRSLGVPIVIVLGAVLILVVGGAFFHHAAAATNHVALSSQAKGVTVVTAEAAKFRNRRRYVATIEPWLRANVGPQLVAAYVDTVLVRPGASVKRGQVLATLDCRNASAADQAVAMSARALDAKRAALEKETSRVNGLLDGGFVAPNEVDQKNAETASAQAQLLATKAQLTGRSLEVADCILRAPFDGEIADRFIDPGAFVRPGQSIVSVVDRGTVRLTADAPENDFDVVAPGAQVDAKLLATKAELKGVIARRAPAADRATRTVHFEIDVPDPARTIPVGTSAELRIDVGEPLAAASIPLSAAAVRGVKASVFVLDGDVAHTKTVKVLGERDGVLFVDGLAPGVHVVSEGRALLADGDRVEALLADKPADATTAKKDAPR